MIEVAIRCELGRGRVQEVVVTFSLVSIRLVVLSRLWYFSSALSLF